jgi:hypothetical protein
MNSKKKKRKPYKFCPEFQAVYDVIYKPPNMKICIKTDKLIRKLIKNRIWNKIDVLYMMPNFIAHEHDALINWKEPNLYDIEIL